MYGDFMGNFENITFLVKTAMVLVLGNFWKSEATFLSQYLVSLLLLLQLLLAFSSAGLIKKFQRYDVN